MSRQYPALQTLPPHVRGGCPVPWIAPSHIRTSTLITQHLSEAWQLVKGAREPYTKHKKKAKQQKMALANFASSGGVDNAAVCQAIELGKIAQDQSTQVVGALRHSVAGMAAAPETSYHTSYNQNQDGLCN